MTSDSGALSTADRRIGMRGVMSRLPALQQVQAHVAAIILPPARTSRAVVICIIVYTILVAAILTVLKAPQDVFMDCAEAYAWGQQFLGGYGRHPPMTGWIAGLWYRVFPAANWSSYALSHVMVGISLTAIYFVARRALDPRRAAFVVFTLMLYPLFHLKSDRFHTYQVLLAWLPLLILVFLIAYEKRTAAWGALLGLVAAGATLTIYSGTVGVLAVGLAALLHRDRRLFFASPAPYCAAAIYLLALSPHIVWLFKYDFSTLRWAEAQTAPENPIGSVLRYLEAQFTWLIMPLAGGLLALWPLRWKRASAIGPQGRDAFLVTVIAAVLVLAPPLVALPLHVQMKPDWGRSQFFLVPVLLLLLMPRLQVTRRTVASSALIAAVWVAIMLVAAPVYPWLTMRLRPNYGSYQPTSEMAMDVTRLWRERYHTPLPLVVSYFDLAAPVVFYSPDHPHMYADFIPAYSPWIDYPAELIRKGYVGVCAADKPGCAAELDKLAPQAEHVTLTESRKVAGKNAIAETFLIWIVAPGS